MVFLFYENKEAIKQKPTKEMGEKLFHENFDLVNDAAELIWEHYDEFDNLVIEGESKLHLFCNGWTKDYYPYSETSLTKKEKDIIYYYRMLQDNKENIDLPKLKGNGIYAYNIQK